MMMAHGEQVEVVPQTMVEKIIIHGIIIII